MGHAAGIDEAPQLRPRGQRQRMFRGVDEILLAINSEQITLHQWVVARSKNGIYVTTPGRVIFNDVLPHDEAFANLTMNKKALTRAVYDGLYFSFIVISS